MSNNHLHPDREWSFPLWSRAWRKIAWHGAQERLRQQERVAPTTVHRWVSGKVDPPRTRWSSLAEFVGKTVEDITRRAR